MFSDLKDHDLLLIILGILVLHVGYSMYTYYNKPKVLEGFYKSCNNNSDCASKMCGFPHDANGVVRFDQGHCI